MKFNVIAALAAACLLGPTRAAVAQEAETGTNGLTALITKVRADLTAGKRTPAELADDLKQFDVLLAAENGKPTELAANILLMKAMLYVQIFNDPDTARTNFLKIKTDYPNTKIGAQMDAMLAGMDKEAAAAKAQAALQPGVPFPDFSMTDVTGKPLSVGQYKGKVVLVDFWATWCGPCRAELPNVIATYAKYHDQGFEIIGVSLDEDKDAMVKYAQENQMTWPQYFDGLRWENKLVDKYGVQGIPFTILIDPQGNIIDKDVRGEALPAAVAKALGK
jgi:thiol-disulfide isomerase/thioredoxin